MWKVGSVCTANQYTYLNRVNKVAHVRVTVLVTRYVTNEVSAVWCMMISLPDERAKYSP